MSNVKSTSDNLLYVSRPNEHGTSVVKLVGRIVSRDYRIKVGQKLQSSDLDDMRNEGVNVREQR